MEFDGTIMDKYIDIRSIIIGLRKFVLGFSRFTKTTHENNRQGIGAFISNTQLLWTVKVSMFAVAMFNRGAKSSLHSKFNYVHFD